MNRITGQSPSAAPDDPLDRRSERDQPAIHLNTAHDGFLARKQREYERRVPKTPAQYLDIKLKLATITALRRQGYVTYSDVTRELTKADYATVTAAELFHLLANAFRVIAAYNSGEERYLRNLVQPIDDARRQTTRAVRRCLGQ